MLNDHDISLIDKDLRQLRNFALTRYNKGITTDLKELIEIQKMIISTDIGICLDKVWKQGYIITDPTLKNVNNCE